MKEFLRKSQEVLRGTVRILVFVQIGLGIIWLFLNLGSVQGFRETGELLEISQNLITDEYVGILYPVLLRIFTTVEQIIPVPYYVYLYILQIGVLFWAIYQLLERCSVFDRIVWTLGVLTFPTVLQFSLAVLPQALAVAMLLFCFYHCRKEKWIWGGCFWLSASLLIPEYFWFGGLLYGFFWLMNLIRKKENRKIVLVKGAGCLLVVSLGCGVVRGLTVEEYSRGRMVKTVESAMMHRMVWPNFDTNSYFWRTEVKDLFDGDDLRYFAKNPESVIYEFGPVMEQTYGLDVTEDIYREMASISFRMRTRETVESIAADFVSYSVPMWSLDKNLEGRGATYSGWNYGRMAENSPGWTKYYVNYSLNVFGILIILSAGMYLLHLVTERKWKRAEWIPVIGYLLVSLFQILWYTMSAAGMQDYKNVIWVSIGWGILFAFSMCTRKAERLQQEEKE